MMELNGYQKWTKGKSKKRNGNPVETIDELQGILYLNKSASYDTEALLKPIEKIIDVYEVNGSFQTLVESSSSIVKKK